MFQNFYDFDADPFRLTPDIRFLFVYKSYAKAKTRLEHGLENGVQVILVTGASGLGKSMLAADILSDLDEQRYTVAKLSNTQLEAGELLRLFATLYAIPVEEGGKELLKQIEGYLNLQAEKGRQILFVVDEAHLLPLHSLKELGLLCKFQRNGHPLVQLICLGRAGLRDHFLNSDIVPFGPDKVVVCRLEPMNREEIEKYILHRLKVAGWTDNPTMSASVFSLVYRASGGVPGIVNHLMSRLLLYGGIEEKRRLDEDDILAVIEEIQSEEFLPLGLELPDTDEEEVEPAYQVESAPVSPAHEGLPPRLSEADVSQPWPLDASSADEVVRAPRPEDAQHDSPQAGLDAGGSQEKGARMGSPLRWAGYATGLLLLLTAILWNNMGGLPWLMERVPETTGRQTQAVEEHPVRSSSGGSDESLKEKKGEETTTEMDMEVEPAPLARAESGAVYVEAIPGDGIDAVSGSDMGGAPPAGARQDSQEGDVLEQTADRQREGEQPFEDLPASASKIEETPDSSPIQEQRQAAGVETSLIADAEKTSDQEKRHAPSSSSPPGYGSGASAKDEVDLGDRKAPEASMDKTAKAQQQKTRKSNSTLKAVTTASKQRKGAETVRQGRPKTDDVIPSKKEATKASNVGGTRSKQAGQRVGKRKGQPRSGEAGALIKRLGARIPTGGDTKLQADTGEVPAARSASREAAPVNVRKKRTPKAILLAGNWKSRHKPATLLPSSLNRCTDRGEAVECVSGLQTAMTQHGKVKYQVETTLSGFTPEGRFQVHYQTKVALAGSDTERGGQGEHGGKPKWQITDHYTNCRLVEDNTVICSGEKGQPREYRRE